MNLRAHKHYANQRTERKPRPHPGRVMFLAVHRFRRIYGRRSIFDLEIGRVERFTFITSPCL